MDLLGYAHSLLVFLNPFGIAGILTGIGALIFGFFVFLQNPERALYKKWLIFSLSVSVWGFGAFFISIAHDPLVAYADWKLFFGVGVIWIPVTFLSFALIFCEVEGTVLIAAVYISAVFFSVCSLFTNYLFEGVRFIFGSFYYAVPDFRLFSFFLVWWFGLIIYTHYLLLKTYPAAKDAKRLQIKYYFIAVAAGFVTGSLAFLPFFHIDVYPWGTFGIPLYMVIMSYAMLEHQLLEINIAVKNALISSVIVALIAWGLLVLGDASNLLAEQFSIPLPVTTIFGALIAFLLGSIFWQRTRSLDRLKYEFLLVAAHKLRTPLTEIRWATSELEGIQTVDEAASIIKILNSASDQLLTLTKTLLDSMQGEDRSYMYRFEACNISELVEKVLGGHRHSLSLKNIHASFSSNVRDTLVRGDEARLTEAIQIFIDNAIIYTPQNGSITIDVSSHNKDSILFQIRDDGIGIEKSEQRHLFERLHRGRNAVHAYPDGSGLGLFMAKQILERHKGLVGVTSDGVDKGSTFWFILPVSKPHKD
jgi:signal transduction histidine kinase